MLPLFLIANLPRAKPVRIIVSVYNIDSETIAANTVEDLYKKKPKVTSYDFVLENNSFFYGNNKYDTIVFGRNPSIGKNEFPIVLDEGHISRIHGRLFSRINRILYENLSQYESVVGERVLKNETCELQNKDVIKMGLAIAKNGYFHTVKVQVNF